MVVVTSQLLFSTVSAQTCSCGGPPILGSLESLPGAAGNLQIGVTYENHSISDLVNFSRELDDDTRTRDSRAILIQADYSYSSRITFSFSLPFVRQSRIIQSKTGLGENLQTRGIGDIAAIVKYSLIPTTIFSKQSIAIGFGAKFPTGKSELRDNGLLISADMQSGTGSLDYLLWGATSRVISRNLSMNLFASSLYRINGTNHRFGVGDDSYKFGNEFRLVAGGSYRLVTGIIHSIGIRYRHNQADKFIGLPFSNSGGQWYDLESGLSTNFYNNIGLNITAQIPVYRRVEGTQFSTSYSISFSLLYNLNLKGSGNEILYE